MTAKGNSDFEGCSKTETSHPFFGRENLAKKLKISHCNAEAVSETEDKHGNLVLLRALVNTGASSSLMLSDFVTKGR